MIIEKNILADKLKKLKDVESKNRVDSMFQGILVEADTIMAANGSYSVRLPLECTAESSFVLPRDAVELIFNLPSGEVEIAIADETTIRIRGGAVKAKFKTRRADDFPKYIGPVDANPQSLPWSELSTKLSSILFACSTESSKPIMTGVHFFSDGQILNLLSCDGFRLAWEQMPFSGEIDFVIGKDTLQKLISICTGEELTIHKMRSAIVFKTEDFEMNARLLEGKYPPIEKQMPDYRNTALVDLPAMLSMVRRARPLSNTIIFDTSADAISVQCKGETAQYSEEIALNSPLREPLKIAFNCTYCAEMFNALKANEEIELGFYDEKGAALRPCTIKAGTYQGMLLPIRLPE